MGNRASDEVRPPTLASDHGGLGYHTTGAEAPRNDDMIGLHGRHVPKKLIGFYERSLQQLNEMKALGGDGCELDAIASVTDYVLDQLESLKSSGLSLEKCDRLRSGSAQFATPEVCLDDGSSTGAR